MQGKTIGIIGCGRIGQVVASCAKTMGMNVVGFDPVMDTEAMTEAGIQKVSLDEIWATCDFITVHTPLTEDTKDILNDQTIAKCKRGVGIVNCARGGIVDEDALLRGLESGECTLKLRHLPNMTLLACRASGRSCPGCVYFGAA